MLISTLSILVTLGIVIFVHELGHFFVALWSGVKVQTFSLGFGPEIIGFNHKGIRYRISAFPVGGYVKMKGESIEDEDARESDAFMGLDPIKRIAVIAAGPVMNFVAGMLIFSILIYSTGIPQFVDKPIIGAVAPESPAYKAGIKAGDKIISIDGNDIETWQELSIYIGKSSKKKIELKVEREGQIIPVSVEPEINEDLNRALIGITASFETVKLGLLDSLWEGIRYTVILCLKLMAAIWLMITGKMAAAVSGPVGIAKVVSQAAGQGIAPLFQLIALISVNLGFINLFPIPILDGGHIVFAIIEKIKGSPLNEKMMNIANVIGLSLILALFIFATWQDIIRIFLK